MKFAAIITARGGSKGLPRKNVARLAGRPLIDYTIRAALDCPLVGRCLVSTEDPEIRRVSLARGAEVLERPARLAGDKALSRDVVRHVLQTLAARGERPELFVLLQPTSPLRTAAHLTACLKAFAKSGAASAISVTEEEHHPFKAFSLSGKTLEPLFSARDLDAPRQSLPRAYRQNGAIYAARTRDFLRRSTFYLRPAMPYVMSREDSVDIDTASDLAAAAGILKKRKERRS